MTWKSNTGTRAKRLQAELRGRAERQQELDARFEKIAAERDQAREVFDRLQAEYRDLRAAELIGQHVTFARDTDSGPETNTGTVRDTWPGFASIVRDGATEAIVVPVENISATSYVAETVEHAESDHLAVA